jgi:16S rRNA (guanine527-N7)-methyltransferase
MELLREEAKGLGLTLSPSHLALFELYYQELSSWNERFNLTAIKGYDDIQRKHFLDSLSCLLALPNTGLSGSIPNTVPLQRASPSRRFLDVGSGAGFPGLPLKIMLPEIKMTLIEARAKKAGFLEHLVDALGLEHVQVCHARAEDLGQMPEHREHYDIVLARAVAHLAVLAEYCLPFCRLGGRMIALKGENAEKEAKESCHALKVLGGSLTAIKAVALPGIDLPHYLMVIDKESKTPDRYPRRVGVPTKHPLH